MTFPWFPLNNPFLWIFANNDDNPQDNTGATMHRYSIGSCNINKDLDAFAVRRCGEIVNKADIKIVHFQEIKAEDLAVLRESLPNHQFYCTATNVPIAVHESMKVVASGFQHTTKHSSKIPTPDRYFAYVDINLGFTTARFTGTWMINKAWNLKPDPHKAERKTLWTEHYMEQNAFIESSPDTTFFSGDMNRAGGMRPYANGKWIEGSMSIDKVGVKLRHGETVTVLGTQSIDTPSDHPLKIVRIQHS